MDRLGLVIVLVAFFGSVGCNQTEKQPAPKPAVTAEGSGAKHTRKPAPRKSPLKSPEVEKPVASSKPAEPSPGQAQCAKILDKAFLAIQPAMKMLAIGDPAAIEADYKKSAVVFRERCPRLSADKRACLEKDENPISAIDSCKVNEGLKPSEKVWAPSLEKYIGLFKTEALPDGQAKKILSGLRGKWVCNWKEAKTYLTWIIKKDGEVAETRRGPGGKVSQKHFKISFVNRDRMRVNCSERSAQEFTFFKASRRMFFAGDNLAYGFYPVRNRKSFVVRDSGDYIFFDNGNCKVVNVRGLLIDGKCSFKHKRGSRIFMASWHYPGQLFPDGKPRVQQRAFIMVGKNLVDERLYRSSRFVKR